MNQIAHAVANPSIHISWYANQNSFCSKCLTFLCYQDLFQWQHIQTHIRSTWYTTTTMSYTTTMHCQISLHVLLTVKSMCSILNFSTPLPYSSLRMHMILVFFPAPEGPYTMICGKSPLWIWITHTGNTADKEICYPTIFSITWQAKEDEWSPVTTYKVHNAC